MSGGISVDDVAWIQRDQFLHYVNGARLQGDPRDWPSFRHILADALGAAFGFDDADVRSAEVERLAALGVVDGTCATSPPTTSWQDFVEGVWVRRREIRPDLL